MLTNLAGAPVYRRRGHFDFIIIEKFVFLGDFLVGEELIGLKLESNREPVSIYMTEKTTWLIWNKRMDENKLYTNAF
jgi:hypothetical protein